MIKGFAFPFSKGKTSFPQQAEDEDVIRASIIQIVSTGLGQRLMRPGFGCKAFDFIFENDTEFLQIMIEREIRSSLSKWEPRIRVESVTAIKEENLPSTITVDILYTILNSNQLFSVSIAGGT